MRLLYLHVPTAWLAMYVSFGVTSLASVFYLWPRTRSRFWDLTAGASAEIGVVFLGLTLLIGSIWGRTTWGVWWTWDARLTTTAVLFVLYLGYLAVRRVVADPEVAAKRAAIVAIAAFLDVPLVHKSVEWWRTLHQPASLFDERRLLDPQINGRDAADAAGGVLAFTLLYAWLLIHRFRLAWLEDRAGDRRMEVALAERHAEAVLADAARRGRTPTAARRRPPSTSRPTRGRPAPGRASSGHPGADLMTHAAYIFAGYGLTTAVLAGYATWVITAAGAWPGPSGSTPARSDRSRPRRLWLAAVGGAGRPRVPRLPGPGQRHPLLPDGRRGGGPAGDARRPPLPDRGQWSPAP